MKYYKWTFCVTIKSRFSKPLQCIYYIFMWQHSQDNLLTGTQWWGLTAYLDSRHGDGEVGEAGEEQYSQRWTITNMLHHGWREREGGRERKRERNRERERCKCIWTLVRAEPNHTRGFSQFICTCRCTRIYTHKFRKTDHQFVCSDSSPRKSSAHHLTYSTQCHEQSKKYTKSNHVHE